MENIDLLITLTHNEDNSNNVTIAFSMGLMALEKGHDVELLLLSNGVFLAKKGYADKIDIGSPFEPLKKLIPEFLNNGGRLKVCTACMKHNGVEETDLIEGASMITADYVVDALMSAKKSLQLN
ncbi:DsrE family protein [Guggenheimella bovis]